MPVFLGHEKELDNESGLTRKFRHLSDLKVKFVLEINNTYHVKKEITKMGFNTRL